MVCNESLWSGYEINIAVDSTEVPHILSLQVRAVAPAVNADRYVVVALANEVGNIEVSIGVGTL